MSSMFRAFAGLALVLALPAPATAQWPVRSGWGPWIHVAPGAFGGPDGEAKAAQARRAQAWMRAHARDAQLVRDFASWLDVSQYPPGFRQVDALTPGLRDQLRRGGTIPPLLEGDVRPVPAALAERLSPLDDGEQYVAMHGRVYRVRAMSREIVDLFEVPQP